MMISLTGATNGEVASLTTPNLQPTIAAASSTCAVRFYYYLSGGTTGSVRVSQWRL